MFLVQGKMIVGTNVPSKKIVGTDPRGQYRNSTELYVEEDKDSAPEQRKGTGKLPAHHIWYQTK